MLRRDALMVFLCASPATLAARTRGSGRPALTSLSHDEEVAAVLARRLERYRAAADLCLQTDEGTPQTIARAILDAVETGPIAKAALSGFLSFLGTTPISGAEFEDVNGRIRTGTTWYNGLYAVIGNPCLHSRSPAVFNPLFVKYPSPLIFREDPPENCIEG